MKSLLLFLCVSLAMSVCWTCSAISAEPDNQHSPMLAENEKVITSFTRKLDFNDLVKLKLDLSEKGITLTFRKLVFDDFGRLSEISFNVDCHDGFRGGAEGKVSNEPFGFYRDYDNEANPFGTGDLSEHIELGNQNGTRSTQ